MPRQPIIRLSLVVLIGWLAAAGGGRAADLEQSLQDVEVAFADSVARGDWQAFQDHIAEDAVFVSGRPLIGKPAVLEAWKSLFGADAPALRWWPEISVIQPGGKLGLSRGPYTLTTTNAAGESEIRHGEFISIWELQDDGTWKIIFDSGCPACVECSSE